MDSLLSAMAAQVVSTQKKDGGRGPSWCKRRVFADTDVLGQVGHGHRLVAGFFIKTVLNEEGQGIIFYGVSNQQTLQMT